MFNLSLKYNLGFMRINVQNCTNKIEQFWCLDRDHIISAIKQNVICLTYNKFFIYTYIYIVQYIKQIYIIDITTSRYVGIIYSKTNYKIKKIT